VVLDVNGLVLAQVLQKLGAGRTKAGEAVNYSVGAELLVSLGQRVQKDQINLLQKALTVGKDKREAGDGDTLVAEVLLPH
ncbi:hypothetical protein GOODEAATRI_024550, partial [Goodea atripinnis]